MVTIYTQEGCKFCTYLKSFLSEYAIDYTEKNLTKSEHHRNEFLDLGGRGVPLTIIDEDLYSGFSEELKIRLTKKKALG
ncbi:glutaredoxin family protein [Bacillus sp. Marseille-P3800]|uniref:glutaredoxin family protein n=1 Tax=Bacillus sp. Marseille-P3800 TaxID=2014782 RepID=UPI000C07EBCD|nr:glutaredoxin domain-containing protein [Bacillus sp. Marseille-P3800]